MGVPPGQAKLDAVQEAESALKALREAKDTEGQQRATDSLGKALEKLKQQQAAGRRGLAAKERPR